MRNADLLRDKNIFLRQCIDLSRHRHKLLRCAALKAQRFDSGLAKYKEKSWEMTLIPTEAQLEIWENLKILACRLWTELRHSQTLNISPRADGTAAPFFVHEHARSVEIPATQNRHPVELDLLSDAVVMKKSKEIRDQIPRTFKICNTKRGYHIIFVDGFFVDGIHKKQNVMPNKESHGKCTSKESILRRRVACARTSSHTESKTGKEWPARTSHSNTSWSFPSLKNSIRTKRLPMKRVTGRNCRESIFVSWRVSFVPPRPSPCHDSSLSTPNLPISKSG